MMLRIVEEAFEELAAIGDAEELCRRLLASPWGWGSSTRQAEAVELLGKVHRRAETVVEVGGMAMDGIAWGAKKLGDRRRRRRKSRAEKAAAAGGAPAASQVEAKLDDRRAADENDNDRDSPSDDPRDKRK